ncbi:MAG: protein phosphatase CheZ [Alphaproteobacteria bacterium]|nr:protein phosphatase CheZ [Alphaproteobacteria bacterium]
MTKVSGGIELLVDHFRADPDRNVSLGDVAAVTEVLMSSMQRYFSSVDVSIYEEFRNLSEHISQARMEISELRPNDLKETKLPRAGAELEAIVQSTEDATGTIMDAAEEIMGLDGSDAEAYQAAVTDACMRIFEACSFQDITGQRISKVVRTLTYIEDRLNMLQQAWGPDIEDAGDEVGDPDEDTRLLNGPALEGEGIQQDAVDDLLANAAPEVDDDEEVSDDAAPTETAETEPIETASDDIVEEEVPQLAGDEEVDGEAAESETAESKPAEDATPAEAPVEPPAKAADKAKANGNGEKSTKTKKAAAKPKKKPEPEVAPAEVEDDIDLPEPEEIAAAGEQVSQAEIDALFD